MSRSSKFSGLEIPPEQIGELAVPESIRNNRSIDKNIELGKYYESCNNLLSAFLCYYSAICGVSQKREKDSEIDIAIEKSIDLLYSLNLSIKEKNQSYIFPKPFAVVNIDSLMNYFKAKNREKEYSHIKKSLKSMVQISRISLDINTKLKTTSNFIKEKAIIKICKYGISIGNLRCYEIFDTLIRNGFNIEFDDILNFKRILRGKKDNPEHTKQANKTLFQLAQKSYSESKYQDFLYWTEKLILNEPNSVFFKDEISTRTIEKNLRSLIDFHSRTFQSMDDSRKTSQNLKNVKEILTKSQELSESLMTKKQDCQNNLDQEKQKNAYKQLLARQEKLAKDRKNLNKAKEFFDGKDFNLENFRSYLKEKIKESAPPKKIPDSKPIPKELENLKVGKTTESKKIYLDL